MGAALDPFVYLAGPHLFLALFLPFLRWKHQGLAVTQLEDKVLVSPLTEASLVCKTDLSLSLHELLEQKPQDLLMMGELNEAADGRTAYKCNSGIIIARHQLSLLFLSH